MHLLYVTDQTVDVYLVNALREVGHVVEAINRPHDGAAMAAAGGYQAIVLDWSEPHAGVVARFAGAGLESLLIVICAAGDPVEHADLLRAGADACFVKPVAFIELEARLAALARLVRRLLPASAFVPVEMIETERAVRVNDRRVGLSAREFHLMAHFAAHPGEVIGLTRLEQQVWGDTAEPRPDLVRTCVSRLRRKLKAAGAGDPLRAVTGRGYIFLPNDAGER